MIRLIHILMIAALLLGGATACKDNNFKETRAELLEKKKERKLEYEAKKQAEEQAQKELEAKALAEARVDAERLAAQAASGVADTTNKPVIVQRYEQDSLLLQFERRPCFGRCPVYKIKVFESGYTTYEGVNFVEYMGYYQARLSAAEIASIYQMVAEADYFSLNDRYDNENIMDLPSMIFRVQAMGKDKRIVARYEIPDELNRFAEQIDQLFADTDWHPVHQ
ncbi:MAG: hypothetical protein HKN79_09775 [Flavobacteriales bacterium]|nr:hypothetical protein [Flavobacteriales bacterium]